MASLSLKNITKIYPHSGDDAKKAKKAKKGEEPEKKKSNLKVTAEGVIAVQEFNLDKINTGSSRSRAALAIIMAAKDLPTPPLVPATSCFMFNVMLFI